MKNLVVFAPNKNISEMLISMIKSFSSAFEEVEIVDDFNNINNLNNKKLLFAAELDNIGVDVPMLGLMSYLHDKGWNSLQNCIACVLIHSSSELGTKRFAQDIIFAANSLGCTFIGQPVIEATNDLKNFFTWQKTLEMSLETICFHLCSSLGKRLNNYIKQNFKNPKLVVLYSSPHKISNTLNLWHMVSSNLLDYSINEIQIENGKVLDCKGCYYNLCLHYGKQNSCFYGGFMVENVLPAIEEADAVVWLCPNYNDAISANLTAVINRLTVLYYKMSFYNKLMYGIVVSGNSGSDSVGKQLIGSLNINKGFHLPPYSVLTATANDPDAVFKIPRIEETAQNFSKHIIDTLQ